MTENEVLTLSSIIEKEAVIDAERPLISAVYHNRLRKKMQLQADPTAIYGIKTSREKITRNDLLRKTPYNTYQIKGLPPGPIASPGLKSITAALYPADVPYLYFVSLDDRTHQFSTTDKEHVEAVKLYRKRQQEIRQGTTDTIGKNMATRKKTKKLFVGTVAVGGGSPISVQSMTKTDTRDVKSTVRQIQSLEKAGCEIIRVAVPDIGAARALGDIIKAVKIRSSRTFTLTGGLPLRRYVRV